MVQQILEVVRLMGGDEQRAFIVHAAADVYKRQRLGW